MMIHKTTMNEIVLICCLAMQYGIYSGAISYYFAIALSLIFCLFWYLRDRKIFFRYMSVQSMGYLILPIVLGLLYSCILFLLYQNTYIDFVKLFSRTLFYSATLLQAISLIELYGKKAIDILFSAAALFYSARVLEYILQNGFVSLFEYVSTTLSGSDMSVTSVLEAHEVTFVFGLFFIYYFSRDIALYKKKIILALLYMLLGYKRIMVLALILALIVVFFIKKTYFKRFSVAIVSALTCLGSFVWLYLIKDNQIAVYANMLNINFMGRLSLNKLLSVEYEISPQFFGKGLGYLDVWSQIHTAETNGIAPHNDTALMYIELGFIFFILYFVYYLYLLYSKAKSSFKYIWPGLFCYTVICWTTDNVQVYFNYQVVLLSILYLLISQKSSFQSGDLDV